VAQEKLPLHGLEYGKGGEGHWPLEMICT